MSCTIVLGVDDFSFCIFGGTFSRKYGTFKRLGLEEFRDCELEPTTPKDVLKRFMEISRDEKLIVCSFSLSDFPFSPSDLRAVELECSRSDLNVFAWAALNKVGI